MKKNLHYGNSGKILMMAHGTESLKKNLELV